MRPPTDFYVRLNIARCLFSRSKRFEQPRKSTCPCRGRASSPKSGSLCQTCGVCTPSGSSGPSPFNPNLYERERNDGRRERVGTISFTPSFKREETWTLCSKWHISKDQFCIKAHFLRAAVQGAESGQDAGGLLHQTVRFPCGTLPRMQLQAKS